MLSKSESFSNTKRVVGSISAFAQISHIEINFFVFIESSMYCGVKLGHC